MSNFPPNLEALTKLPHDVTVTIKLLLNIATSAYSQLDQLKLQRDRAAKWERGRYGSAQTSGKQMLKLSVQDSQNVKATAAELERIPQLSMNTLVGTKLRIKQGTLIRKRRLLLTPKDVVVLGGNGNGGRLPPGAEDPAVAYERLLCSVLDIEDTTRQGNAAVVGAAAAAAAAPAPALVQTAGAGAPDDEAEVAAALAAVAATMDQQEDDEDEDDGVQVIEPPGVLQQQQQQQQQRQQRLERQKQKQQQQQQQRKQKQLLLLQQNRAPPPEPRDQQQQPAEQQPQQQKQRHLQQRHLQPQASGPAIACGGGGSAAAAAAAASSTAASAAAFPSKVATKRPLQADVVEAAVLGRVAAVLGRGGKGKRVRVEATVKSHGTLTPTAHGWQLPLELIAPGSNDSVVPMVLTNTVLQPLIGCSTEEFKAKKKLGKVDKAVKKALTVQITKGGDKISKRWQAQSMGAFTVESGDTHGESKLAVVAFTSGTA